MKMRPPAIPLVTVDPYFSIWSMSDKLAGHDTYHWSGIPHKLTGTVCVDKTEYLFLGRNKGIPLEQKSFDMNLFTSEYVFENDLFILTARFTTPLLIDDIEIMSRPVSYIETAIRYKDEKEHTASLKITAGDELCLDKPYESPTIYSTGEMGTLKYATLENTVQNVLEKSGDDLRIDYGRLYLASADENTEFSCGHTVKYDRTVANRIEMTLPLNNRAVVAIAYDDIKSLTYFGSPIDGCWKRYDSDIREVIIKALAQYDSVMERCNAFSKRITADAEEGFGAEYAELITLAWRQTLAAHKLAVTESGELIFASKECFSDGDVATVDVTYPSAPMFLLYNPELLKGMLFPIFEYAASDMWEFDCAPHDMGLYPRLDGQEYKDSDGNIMNMPVEECGNMIILTAAYVKASGDTAFAKKYMHLLKDWVVYLIENGEDPEYQLCTDDFAGRSAHNCNLTLKAIMGVACYGLINGMLADTEQEKKYLDTARKMAAAWEERTVKPDGSYRMAFDLPDTFSLKYNMMWDVIFETGLFSKKCITNELSSYTRRMNRYGVPLDNRADYTKSDWIVWCAAMTEDKKLFGELVKPVWTAYNETSDRVPMGDWYDSNTAEMILFRNRTVQGGLFAPLLKKSGLLSFKK